MALAGIGTAVALYPVVKRQGVLGLRFDDVQALLKTTICLTSLRIGQNNKLSHVLRSENMRPTRQPGRGMRPQPPLASGRMTPKRIDMPAHTWTGQLVDAASLSLVRGTRKGEACFPLFQPGLRLCDHHVFLYQVIHVTQSSFESRVCHVGSSLNSVGHGVNGDV